jgi:hypothetical protein
MHAHAGRLVKYSDAWRFFRSQGFDSSTATALASAEQGIPEGWHVHVEDESEPWDGEENTAPRFCYCVVLRDGERNVLGSLGMIGVDQADDPYLRVVSAELILEALDARSTKDRTINGNASVACT